MINELVSYIQRHNLFTSGDTILVAVSGGMDSVVLLDLLEKAGYALGIAHCNFHLRGEESDGDEALVARLAEKYGRRYYHQSFDTEQYANEHGYSIEMAARELRYDWFEKIRAENHYDVIAVAHHRDDLLETFFLNLSRGTGLKGMTGIKPKNGRVVRPLLFATRAEIANWCIEHELEYRDDSSNSSLDYQRNKIRHQLLPLMEELNPSFRESLQKTIHYLKDVSTIYFQEIQQCWERVAIRKGREYHLSISELKLLEPMHTYLFEFLKPFHFNSEVVTQIQETLEGEPGKQFFSPTHRVVRDRDHLIITQLPGKEKLVYYIDEGLKDLTKPLSIQIRKLDRDQHFRIPRSAKVACIDLDKIQFPLKIRKWEQGDFFRPLGMNGFKKLSDFFIDEKMSLPEKENTWLVTNGEQVVWIIGKRIDDRYKITDETTRVLELVIGGK